MDLNSSLPPQTLHKQLQELKILLKYRLTRSEMQRQSTHHHRPVPTAAATLDLLSSLTNITINIKLPLPLPHKVTNVAGRISTIHINRSHQATLRTPEMAALGKRLLDTKAALLLEVGDGTIVQLEVHLRLPSTANATTLNSAIITKQALQLVAVAPILGAHSHLEVVVEDLDLALTTLAT